MFLWGFLWELNTATKGTPQKWDKTFAYGTRLCEVVRLSMHSSESFNAQLVRLREAL